MNSEASGHCNHSAYSYTRNITEQEEFQYSLVGGIIEEYLEG